MSTMCNFCELENRVESVNIFSKEDENRILNAIYLGFINERLLDYRSYVLIATFLESETWRGYGKSISEVVPGDNDESMLKGFKDNIYAFSAAKVFQQTLELMAGREKAIDEWITEARVIFRKYNSEYLAIEGDSAYHQGLSAKDWRELVKWSYEQDDTTN